MEKAAELVLSSPERIALLLSPNLSPLLFSHPSLEKNWSLHSCAREKNIFIYLRESALLNWFVGLDKTSLCALSAPKRMGPQSLPGRGSAFGELWSDNCNFI